MTTAAAAQTTTPQTGEAMNGSMPADTLVIFGITGDLAKVMTFHSLYRLESRGLLDCPIVGVAANDWSVDDLRTRARTSIEECGETIDPEQVFARLRRADVVHAPATSATTPTPTRSSPR